MTKVSIRKIVSLPNNHWHFPFFLHTMGELKKFHEFTSTQMQCDKPLQIVDKLLQDSSTKFDSVVLHFTRLLQNEENYKEIPLLTGQTVGSLSSGQLVKYRGMIQDLMEPEFFHQRYQVKRLDGSIVDRHGYCREFFDCEDDEHPVLDFACVTPPAERQVAFISPIPGETLWAQKELLGRCPGVHSRPDEASDTTSLEEPMEMEQNEVAETPAGESGGGKRRKVESEAVKSSAGSNLGWSPETLRLPVPGDSRLPCIAKIYSAYDSLRIHDAVEVVGVLYRDAPRPVAPLADDDVFGAAEAEIGSAQFNPPPNLAPRLHVLVLRRLSHTSPLLPRNTFVPSPEMDRIWSSAAEMKDTLSTILNQLFLGDHLLAQYLFLHMISNVHTRQVSLHSASHLSLNIVNVRPQFDLLSKMTKFLSLVAPQVVPVALTLDLLNSGSPNFMPIKDVTSQRLLSGRLQLARNTHLLLDETTLSDGQLQSRGCLNVRSIKNVMENQLLDVDCQYHRAEVPVDVRVMVLSEGRSIFKSGCIVPWEPLHFESDDSVEKAFQAVMLDLESNPDVVGKLREYLAVASLPSSAGGRPKDYTINQELQKVIEETFVVSRRTENRSNEKLSPEDLNLMLTLMRLHCYSTAEINTQPTVELWNQIVDLEKQRKERIK